MVAYEGLWVWDQSTHEARRDTHETAIVTQEPIDTHMTHNNP